MLDIHKEMMHFTMAIIIGSALLVCMEYFNRLQMPFGDLSEKIPILPKAY